MPVLTAGELNLLRGGSQHSELYMVVQQPEYRQHGEWTGYEWSGVVVASHVVPIAGITAIYGFEVTSDGGATLYDGMTVLISHVERGAWDLGIVRLHGDQTIGAGAEDIWIAPSSDLSTVAAGDFIVVLDEFKVWSRYPWVEEAAGALTWYKDYGYFRQVLAADGLTWAQLAGAEACLPPAAIMGPHAVAFIEARVGATVDIDFNWSDTYHNYPGVVVDDWDAWGEDGGGGWNVPNTENPPPQTYMNVSGLGGYRVRLEVERGGANNPPVEYRRGIRYVFTLRRPGETMAGDPPNAEPITDFQVTGMSGSFASGRWRASIRIYGDQAHEYLILPGALVILFVEDWYGGAKKSIGPLDKSTTSPLKNRENIVLIGRIADGTIRQDSETGDISFDILSAAELATKRENYPVVIENNDVPAEWYEAPDLTVGRAAWHYACWHTTLPLVCDFYNVAEPDAPVGNDYEVAAQDFLEGNMYATIDTFLQNRLMGRLLCDRYERFNCVIDRQIQAPAGGVTVFALQDGDRLGASQIREVEELPVSIVDIGGVFYDVGAGILGLPLMSHAPGEVSKYWGTPEQSTSLALGAPGDAEAAVQAILNTLSGRVLAYRNNEFPTLSLNQGNWRAMDIWPQEYISVTLTTERHTFSNDLFIAREFSYAFQPAEGTFTTTTVLEKETDGPPGVTVIIPDEIPDLPREPIKWPPWEPPGPGDIIDLGRRFGPTNVGIAVTDNIGATPPVWYIVDAGLDNVHLYDDARDPFHWWTSGGTERRLYVAGPTGLWYMDDFPDGIFVQVLTRAQLLAPLGRVDDGNWLINHRLHMSIETETRLGLTCEYLHCGDVNFDHVAVWVIESGAIQTSAELLRIFGAGQATGPSIRFGQHSGGQILYAGNVEFPCHAVQHLNRLWKTVDGGLIWNNIHTVGIPKSYNSSLSIPYLDVDNPDRYVFWNFGRWCAGTAGFNCKISDDLGVTFPDLPGSDNSYYKVGTGGNPDRVWLLASRPDLVRCRWSDDRGITWNTLPLVATAQEATASYVQWGDDGTLQTALIAGWPTAGAPGTQRVWYWESGDVAWTDKTGNIEALGVTRVYDLDRDSMGGP